MKPILLTPSLGRAARAFLKWQQADLAEATHLSLATVNNFEREIGVVRESTLQAIQKTFENNSIEFLPGGGFRHTDEIAELMRFSGRKVFVSDWTHHVMRTILVPGEEILVSSYDEDQWFHPHHLQSSKDFFAWLERMNVKVKKLISDGKKARLRPNHSFRIVPPEMIGKITYAIYGHEIGFALWKKKQVIVVHNIAVAETFRNQFKYLWKMGKPVH